MSYKDSDLHGKSRTFNTDTDFDTTQVKNKLSNIKNNVVDEVEDTAQTLADRASDMKDSAVRNVKKTVNSFADTASDVRDRVTDTLQNTYETVRDKAIDVEEDVVVLVKENPVKSLAITLLAGIGIGLLLRK